MLLRASLGDDPVKGLSGGSCARRRRDRRGASDCPHWPIPADHTAVRVGCGCGPLFYSRHPEMKGRRERRPRCRRPASPWMLNL